MPRSYATQFRAMVIEQVRAGRRIAEVAAMFELPESTVFRWVRQDQIDRGELTGTSTAEAAQLRAAKRRIGELEAELATVKRATEFFDKGRVMPPKRPLAIVETLASEGHGTKRVCRLLHVAPQLLPMALDAAQCPGWLAGPFPAEGTTRGTFQRNRLDSVTLGRTGCTA